MDLKVLMDGPDARWTEERHSVFLNWIEASFVRRIIGVHLLGGGGAVPCRCTEMHGGLRLDRYVPDSATESTEDSRRRSPAATATATATAASAAGLRSERRCASIFPRKNTKKRPLARLQASSHDQVVPEIENNDDGDGVFVKRKHGRRGF